MSHVVIAGAGIVGLTTAVELANAGHNVTVLDPAPASGATHHAGGMLAPAAEVVYQQDPLFPLMQAAGAWHPRLIELVAAHTDLPTGYRTEGTLVVAADRADAQHLSELLDYQTAHGMEVERITTRAARSMEPALSPRLAGAVSIPGDTQLFPRMFAAAALDAVRNLGADVRTERVTRITPDGEVTTDQGTHHANAVVLAAGLGAAHINGWYEDTNPLQLRPVYGDILRLRVPESLQPLVTRVVRGFVEDRPIYVIPRVDGTIAVGATTREDDLPRRVGSVYDLLRDAIRVVPGLEECELLEVTTGARPGTPDALPYLGRLPHAPQIIVSTGYFRHGILLSALAARMTRELIEEQPLTLDLTACHPLRHKD